MAWWKRDGRPVPADSATSTVVVEIDLPSTVDDPMVWGLVAAWRGATDDGSESAALAPGLLLGGPDQVDGRVRWFVLAARTEDVDPWSDLELDIDVDDSAFALVGAVAGLAQAWLDQRPPGRQDLVCGPPAFALALADGIARRLGGSVRIDGGPWQPPVPREPTRVLYLSEWMSPADASDIVSGLFPGLEVVDGGETNDAWVVAQPGGYGLIFSARDPGSRIPVETTTWRVDASPQLAPLLSRPEQPWTTPRPRSMPCSMRRRRCSLPVSGRWPSIWMASRSGESPPRGGSRQPAR